MAEAITWQSGPAPLLHPGAALFITDKPARLIQVITNIPAKLIFKEHHSFQGHPLRTPLTLWGSADLSRGYHFYGGFTIQTESDGVEALVVYESITPPIS
jgi:hypothetical protein